MGGAPNAGNRQLANSPRPWSGDHSGQRPSASRENRSERGDIVTQWDSDLLWEKTKLFAVRARQGEQEGVLFPFWSILALELLARTVVAAVHPVLLADPKDGENLLYAFG